MCDWVKASAEAPAFLILKLAPSGLGGFLDAVVGAPAVEDHADG